LLRQACPPNFIAQGRVRRLADLYCCILYVVSCIVSTLFFISLLSLLSLWYPPPPYLCPLLCPVLLVHYPHLVLALAWGQPGQPPLLMDNNGYLLRHHVMSASRLKSCLPGVMVTGPFWNLPVGHHRVVYHLRARHPQHTASSANDKMALPEGDVCTIEVQDGDICGGHGGERGYAGVLFRETLKPAAFETGNHWSRCR
jgi:hypothetical protein